jgi:hypothetical protein
MPPDVAFQEAREHVRGIVEPGRIQRLLRGDADHGSG